jgi:thiamine-phosphate pyrophosphorylase
VLTPRLLIISALDVVPEPVLLERIRAAGKLSPALRSRVAVQLRDPELDGRALYAFGARLREATRAARVALVVNDRLDLARALKAEGVHLGRRSVSVADARAFMGKRVWVSVSCHAVAEVPKAAEAGADAALLSPIFASPGKETPLGVEALHEASRSLPLIAMGGVDTWGLSACFQAGAAGVAAIRADLVQTLVSTLRS